MVGISESPPPLYLRGDKMENIMVCDYAIPAVVTSVVATKTEDGEVMQKFTIEGYVDPAIASYIYSKVGADGTLNMRLEATNEEDGC